MKAGILTIGDEIIAGFTVDTNSAWMAQELLKCGIEVVAKASVGDDHDAILGILEHWDGELDLVIATGGLGPTHDDITKKAFCTYFQSEIRFDEAYWTHLQDRFRKRGYRIPANNRSQAEIPVKASTIPNPVGSALGLTFQSETTTFIVLPGVPTEMKAIINEGILQELNSTGAITWTTLHTTGIFESALSEKLGPLVSSLSNVRVAYLPSYIGVDVRIRGSEVGDPGSKAVKDAVVRIEAEVGKYIYGHDDTLLEELVGQLLIERGETVALAESCSGGLIASRITDVAGSSAYFHGGVVAYSNAAKVAQLGVKTETLEKYGAVSEAIACEMAEGVKALFGVDWGVSTTGISGPTGGTPEKPVGLTYFAVAGPQGTIAKESKLIPHRLPHKLATAQMALNLLRLELLHHE
ncbi:competence/damage-inducible protein A [Candidatus Neomarinimicrobiota bacterium]